MTERFEITTLLQKELSQIPEVFGSLLAGSPEQPAITKESVHHFYKHVSGKPLIRPPWFFDVEQQGEGIVDITTHLVDMIQWEAFPGIILKKEDVEIISEDIPGWLVANEGAITVALDIHVTEELRQEGIARELVNRIQNIRKESGFEVTDKIEVLIERHELISDAVELHGEYIGTQTLAESVQLTDSLENSGSKRIDIDEDVYINIRVSRL